MIATTKIKMDLTAMKHRQSIDVMQDDRYSRDLQISLYAGGVPFEPPADCVALVRCRKADGQAVIYDTLPDGSAACSISGNRLRVALAPQVCTAPGKAEFSITLYSADRQLSCFGISLYVWPQPGGFAASESYVHVTGFVPQPSDAKVGQYLQVAAVENGKITAVRTADCAPGSQGTGDDGAPEYVVREARRVARAAQQRQGVNTLTMAVCSDIHYSDIHPNAALMQASLTHCAQAMELIRRQIHVDVNCVLGDLIWDSGETPAQAKAAMRYVHQLLHTDSKPRLHTRGNHDCLYSHETGLTDAEIFSSVGIYNSGAVCDPNNRLGGYCSLDFPEQKLRLICINTCEASDGSFCISQAQLQWLSEVLDLSDLGDGWGSILLSHHPLDWYGSSQAVVQVLAAAQDVICAIHGHVHGFQTNLITGTQIPRIAVPNVCFYRNNEYGENGVAENSEGIEFGETQTYPKTATCAEDTAFCVITVDRDNATVYADHYGAGYSRVIPLDGSSAQTAAVSTDFTGVTGSCVPESVSIGAAFAMQLWQSDGSAPSVVSVVMDGSDITQSAYSSGRVEIDYVTGPIVIAASQSTDSGDENPEDTTVEQTGDLVPSSIDTDGSIFNGSGYMADYRLGSSGDLKELAGAVVSGFISYGGENIRIGGSDASTAGTLGNYIGLYDSSFGLIQVLGFDNLVNYGATWAYDGSSYALQLQPQSLSNDTAAAYFSAAAYIRCSLGDVAAATDLYVLLDDSTDTEDETTQPEEDSGSDDSSEGFTNLVSTSVDTDGSIYNGTGYLANYRLNSSGSTTAQSGAVASGFIPYSGQVIRILGAASETVGYQGNYLGLYDSTFTKINMLDFGNLVSYGALWETVTDGYVLTVDPAAVSNTTVYEQLCAAAYIRCSVGMAESAADLTVTLDETIN